MIEKLVLIVAILLSQLNIISEDQSKIVFWNQFAGEKMVNQRSDLQKGNWFYSDNTNVYRRVLQPTPRKIKGVSDFNVKAKSAIVLDAKTGAVLYSKNSDEDLPIASLTKIMTALVILDNVDLNAEVIISRNAFNTGGSKNGLAVGEKISVENLLRVMLVNSNNIAAVALAEHTSGSADNFSVLMNEKANLIGLENTEFFNPSGLDGKENNNISTAYEMARLVDYALEKPLIWEILRIQKITVASINGKIEHRLKNTNLLLGKLKNIVGGKTGLTNDAGQCLILIIGDPKNNHRIISVVLNAEDRFSETEKLVKWIFKSYLW
ncbi:MAG: D-alanyl-D-alanine carboxypeptidase family protein [Patescibacteria group bacterium]|nr:D-alanyl-D-alanine carboxypeptidase family protein [Patescibacteria group bacterium]